MRDNSDKGNVPRNRTGKRTSKSLSTSSEHRTTKQDAQNGHSTPPTLPPTLPRKKTASAQPQLSSSVSTTAKHPTPSPLRRALRLLYWGTLLAQFLITGISVTFLYCDTYFWPVTTIRGAIDWLAFLHLFVFCASSALTQYNFLMAIFVGPGYVPENWVPEEEEHRGYLQYCLICEGYKAPRAHHCRTCKRCVQKMEHHCPWINNCVGHRNHAYFLRFLFFATCGCLHAMVVLLIVVLKVLNFVFTDYHYNRRVAQSKMSNWMRLFNFQPPPVFFTLPGLLWIVMTIGFALGVVLAVGALFVIQLRIILKNETSIESWILNKASYYMREEAKTAETEEEEHGKKTERKIRFENPYHLGWWQNAKQVFLNSTHNPVGNGIWWTVRPDCDQFTLTKEQLRQKQFKQEASVDFLIHQNYSGRIFPLFSQGCRKHWLYGSRVKVVRDDDDDAATSSPERRDEKGWFPRRVARRMDSKTD
ncbi:Palmitoyltransferase ZDHHC6 [Hypsibius exemplaris]|uniref:Palmitoyltransferase n=1 Tax=Hypsibius exemplaris TaxID=2072580 RepID=A0A1W0X6K3_HYPEX|nr:Palmitoyltransferase ZDHHC6 [Hypsibius exemplaris]